VIYEMKNESSTGFFLSNLVRWICRAYNGGALRGRRAPLRFFPPWVEGAPQVQGFLASRIKGSRVLGFKDQGIKGSWLQGSRVQGFLASRIKGSRVHGFGSRHIAFKSKGLGQLRFRV